MAKKVKYFSIEYLISLFAVFAIYFALRNILPRPFVLNDELLIRGIASGDYLGEPDGHLVYSLFPFGIILGLLYRLVSNVQWFDLFLLGSHILSWYFITLWVTKHANKVIFKILLSLGVAFSLATLDMKFVVLDYYTVDAALFGAAGMVWILPIGKKEIKTGNIAVSVILLTLCLWLRIQVFFMVLPFAVILLFYLFIAEDKKYVIRLSAVLAGIVFFSIIIDKVAYLSNDWKEYKEYNEARTEIYDYYGTPLYQFSEDTYKSLDYSQLECDALCQTQFGLLSDLDAEKLQILADASKKISEENKGSFSIRVKEAFAASKKEIKRLGATAMGVSVGVLFISNIFALAGLRKTKANWTRYAVTFCGAFYAFAFMTFFLFLGRYPERVSYSLYYLLVTFLGAIFVHFTSMPEAKEKRAFYGLSIVCAIFVIVCNIRYFDVEREKAVSCAEEWTPFLEESSAVIDYCKENSGKKFYVDASLVLTQSSYLMSGTYLEGKNTITAASWIYASPLFTQKINQLGHENICDMLINGQETYMIARISDNVELIPLILNRCGVNVEANLVDTIQGVGGDIGIYRFQRMEE